MSQSQMPTTACRPTTPTISTTVPATTSTVCLLREDDLDHVLDRRLLDREVGDLQLPEQPRRDWRRLRLGDAQLHAIAISLEDLSVGVEWRGAVHKRHVDRLVRGKAVRKRRQTAVEQHAA